MAKAIRSLLRDSYKLQILGTAIAVLLLSFSIVGARLSFGFLGAIQGFPVTYFIALVLSTSIAIFAAGNNSAISWGNVFLVLIALWFVPALIGISSPLEVHTYEMYGYVNNLIETRHINNLQYLFLNWPAWAIEGANLSLISGHDLSMWIIKFSPFAEQLLATGGIYLLSKSVPSDKTQVRMWTIAALIMTAANWTEASSFLPQGYAYALLILFVGFLSRPWLSKRTDTSSIIVILILLGGIILGHLLTSIVAVGILGVMALRSRGGPWRMIFLVAFVAITAWALYWSGIFLNTNLPGYVSALKQFLVSFLAALKEQAASASSSGSYGHIVTFKIQYSVFLAVFGFIGCTLWAIRKTRERMGWYVISVAIGMAISIFTIAGGITAGYILRTFSFELLPISYFAASLTKVRFGHGVIITVLLIAVLGSLVVREGFQPWEYVPPTYVVGLKSFDSYTGKSTVAELKSVLYADPYAFGAFQNRDQYVQISQVEADITTLQTILASTTPRPVYFVATSVAQSVFQYVLQEPQNFEAAVSWLNNSIPVCFYSNGDVRIWVDKDTP